MALDCKCTDGLRFLIGVCSIFVFREQILCVNVHIIWCMSCILTYKILNTLFIVSTQSTNTQKRTSKKENVNYKNTKWNKRMVSNLDKANDETVDQICTSYKILLYNVLKTRFYRIYLCTFVCGKLDQTRQYIHSQIGVLKCV